MEADRVTAPLQHRTLADLEGKKGAPDPGRATVEGGGVGAIIGRFLPGGALLGAALGGAGGWLGAKLGEFANGFDANHPLAKKLDEWMFGKTPPVPGGLAHKSAFHPGADGANPQQLFHSLEAAYQLPDGLLDRQWAAESGRGRYLNSSAGAEGQFQFMPATARQYGVADPYNLRDSAAGAARYLSDLMRQFGGSIEKAVAAYNWGPRNLAKDIERWGTAWQQHLPAETSTYLDRVLGGGYALGGASPVTNRHATVQQQTTINAQVALTACAQPPRSRITSAG